MSECLRDQQADRGRAVLRHAAIALALFAITFLVFIRTRGFDFINFDDRTYVVENARVLSGLTWDNVRWAFSTFKLSNYHPLTWLAYMSIAEVSGANPSGYHLTNVVLHAVDAALVYVLLAGLTRAPLRSAMAAALFAVHPLRMESVAWVAELKDVLCGMFFLLSLIAYERYARGGTRDRAVTWYVASCAAFILGLMVKPMIVTLPCVLVLLDFWPLQRVRRENWRRITLEKTPFAMIAVAFSVLTFAAQRGGGAVAQPGKYPPLLRFGNLVWSYGRYLRKTFWPSDLAVFYPYYGAVPGTTLPWGRVALSGALILSIMLVALWSWRRERAVLIGWLWFLGMLVPTIGIVQAGTQSMADRYTYLPHIGLCVAIVWGSAALVWAHRKARSGAIVAGSAIILALAATTIYQLGYWQNSYTIFNRALAVTHHNAKANGCLGLYFQEHGDPQTAMAQYAEALRIDSNDPDVQNHVGGLLRDQHQPQAALPHLLLAVRFDPKNATARNNLANTLADLARYDDAIRQFESAVKLDPDSATTWLNYAITLAAAGRTDDAIPRFKRALHLRPGDASARYAYALSLAHRNPAAAVEQFRLTLRLCPEWPPALNALAWLLATTPDARVRDHARATALAERAALATNYQQPQPLDSLAAARAAAGAFDQAIGLAQRARQLAADQHQVDLAQHIDERIALYRAGKPFVSPLPPTPSPAR